MTTSEIDYKNVGRNDACPCGSGKKFKKCHFSESQNWRGNSAPLTNSNENSESSDTSGFPGGVDPSQLDLTWMADFSSAIQRLPKGQLQRLQGLMQKMMAGKDVARELAEFQRTLPPNIQDLLGRAPQMNAQADSAGKVDFDALTDEQREKLNEIQKNNAKSGFSRLWNRFRKK